MVSAHWNKHYFAKIFSKIHLRVVTFQPEKLYPSLLATELDFKSFHLTSSAFLCKMITKLNPPGVPINAELVILSCHLMPTDVE